ncbi:MAG TPA: Gfo/Idh/MocA family oxidoreductase [Acidobacteriaceae bacterium]|jgi:predicted dehydrogenase|nr:Gfo/Idh/MocA family oxidoreductase [Acidobacteriaceae bacterium]
MAEQTISELVGNIAAPRPQRPRPIISIGAGSIVHDAHLPAYRKAGFPVAVIVDPDLARAQGLAAQFGVPLATNSLDDAMRQAPREVIFDIAVPAKIIPSILPHLPDGAAVLIQKPMGETLEEARTILQICRDKKLTAAVNFQLRWAPNMMAARKITDAGLLGEIHDMEVLVNVFMPWDIWKFLATAPRLEILYHSIHYIDLIRSWLGNPQRVLAKTVRNPRTPGLSATKSVIVLDYGEWKRVYIAANHGNDYAGDQISQVRWEGTEGAMAASMGVNLDYPTGRPDTLRVARRGEEWQSLPCSGNWFPDAFMGSMGSLQAFVAGEASELPTSVESAMDTMRTVEAAYLSSERDGVELPA